MDVRGLVQEGSVAINNGVSASITEAWLKVVPLWVRQSDHSLLLRHELVVQTRERQRVRATSHRGKHHQSAVLSRVSQGHRGEDCIPVWGFQMMCVLEDWNIA